MFVSSASRKRAVRATGHTLMELMVVMALLAIAASLLLPITMRAYAGFRLRLAADSIVHLMQQAKDRSLFEGRTYLLIFPDSLSLQHDLILAREDGVSIGHYTFPTDISLRGWMGEDNWSSDIGFVAFYPDGTSDGIQLALQNASRSVSRIQLDPLTATARIVLPTEVEP